MISVVRTILILAMIVPSISFSHDNQKHHEGKSKADDLNQCVEPTDVMRKKHFEFLYHQRDLTVIDGIRTKQHSLANCIDCHVSYDSNGIAIPINSEGQFCYTCHIETATKIDCFTCHATIPRYSKKSIYNKINKISMVSQIHSELNKDSHIKYHEQYIE